MREHFGNCWVKVEFQSRTWTPMGFSGLKFLGDWWPYPTMQGAIEALDPFQDYQARVGWYTL